ncbi:MAG TPA: CPBP family intramembrane metalloprotease [Sorangium sp.]|nr:CPBP family intramembrane metalloprotease [Sorangium sp.]
MTDAQSRESVAGSPPAGGVSDNGTLGNNNDGNGGYTHWMIALGVTALAMVAQRAVFSPARAGQRSIVVIAGGCYALLALAAVWWLRGRGQLTRALAPQRGDMTIGALTAGVMYMAGFVGGGVLMPSGSPRNAWLMRIYLHLGDPRARSVLLVGLAVLVIAALEEVVWRGLVQRALAEQLGAGRALLVTSVLYALTHVTTLWQLGDPTAGYNPLLVSAALGGGLVWGAMAWRFGRLLPAVIAHALFSWAVVAFPLWRL